MKSKKKAQVYCKGFSYLVLRCCISKLKNQKFLWVGGDVVFQRKSLFLSFWNAFHWLTFNQCFTTQHISCCTNITDNDLNISLINLSSWLLLKTASFCVVVISLTNCANGFWLHDACHDDSFLFFFLI